MGLRPHQTKETDETLNRNPLGLFDCLGHWRWHGRIACRMVVNMKPKQEEALRDYLQEVITPLIEQVLVKKLGQAMTFAKEELIQPKREWQGLTEDDRDAILRSDGSIFDLTEAKLKERNT